MMLYLGVFVFAALTILGGASAGLHSLPILRTTIGIDLDFPSFNNISQGNRRQVVFGNQDRVRQPTSPPVRKDGHPRAIFDNRIRAPAWIQNRHHGDDDIETLYLSLYTTPVSIGNPPLHLDAIIDTSWSSLFVPSVNCTYDPHEVDECVIHPLYNSSLSETYQANLTPTSLSYTGSVQIYTEGAASRDSFHVAGVEIKEHLFEEVTWWRPNYITKHNVFDTVLGLALFESQDLEKWGNFTAPSPFRNMINQGLLDENIITLQFPRTDSEKGELTLGGLPDGLSRKRMIEVPLRYSRIEPEPDFWKFYTTNGWQVLVDRMSMTQESSKHPLPISDKPQIAIISSSFPWIILPSEVQERIMNVTGLRHGLDWIECDKRGNLPKWTIAFGPDRTITLTPWDYLVEVYDDYHKQLRCVAAFMSLDHVDSEQGFILLGSPFLNGLNTVLDADRESIWFSNRPL